MHTIGTSITLTYNCSAELIETNKKEVSKVLVFIRVFLFKYFCFEPDYLRQRPYKKLREANSYQ